MLVELVVVVPFRGQTAADTLEMKILNSNAAEDKAPPENFMIKTRVI